MMLFLFLFPNVLAKPYKIANQIVSIGIWAGKETLSTRVMDQAKSWMRFWNRVYVFTDDIQTGECESLNKAANPCEVVCVKLGNLAEHLEGTEWRHRWYFAQPRFLPAMASLYEHEPNSSWFLFGDDDTYFLRPAIERKISRFDSREKIVIGKFWSSWERVTQDVPPLREQHPFAQGGAGVCISNEMMQKIGPHLRNCSLFFNDPDFAGSMRFAMCVERVVGQQEWSLDGAIRTWYSGFHSSPPDFEIADKTVTEAPASFHRITSPEMFAPIQRAHIMKETPNHRPTGKTLQVNHENNENDYKKNDLNENNENINQNDAKNGNEYHLKSFDLGLFSFTRQWISLGIPQNRLEWRFGYRVGLQDSKTGFLSAIGDFIPQYSNNELVGFSQKYQKGVKIHCKCANNIPEGEVYFSHFADELGSEPVMLLSCSNITYVEHDT
ncbi:hypothetical protein TRFO_31759 [Tritrichomonas foetus]|uniref:N-acetylgalactosaminide beta-1,3-galactosyltransferase n=1 Tax=Tritrichomonas foetus TaxID=1144522 RepID=A0A1J4JQX1_9EUKA|nr:hypothetical protein TRFO_31759 [Tritrichomonas foetus]|eukprot:OHT01435.1 hypothetical protein TRFO_31759 [Tritrichomonas foetus]